METATLLRYRTNTIQLADNGVVYFRPETNDIYTDKDLMAILDLAEQAAGDRPLLLLMLVNEFEFLMTKEARELFGTYPKAARIIRAEAVVVRSTASRIMYNLLTLLHKPTFPFKAFTQEERAVAWLLKHT